MSYEIKPLSCNPGVKNGAHVDACMDNLNLAAASAELSCAQGA